MIKHTHFYILFFCIILFGSLPVYLGACSSRNGQDSAIRLGYLQNDLHHLPAFVALEKGFFKKEGIEVEVAGIFRAGPEEMSAFAAKELDIGYVGQAPATAAVMNGVADIRFIAQVNLDGSSVVVMKGSAYENLSDLEGKTVAIPGHATMQDFLLRRALQKSNVPVHKVKLIVLKPPEMIQALSLGNIDAFIAWEPYPSQAVRKGIGRVILSSGRIWENHPCCVLIADTEFCNKNPGVVKKIQAVHRLSCEFINMNREEAIEIGIKYTGMDRDTVSSAILNIKYSPVMDRNKGSEFVDFLNHLRYIRKENREKPLSDFFYE